MVIYGIAVSYNILLFCSARKIFEIRTDTPYDNCEWIYNKNFPGELSTQVRCSMHASATYEIVWSVHEMIHEKFYKIFPLQ